MSIVYRENEELDSWLARSRQEDTNCVFILCDDISLSHIGLSFWSSLLIGGFAADTLCMSSH